MLRVRECSVLISELVALVSVLKLSLTFISLNYSLWKVKISSN
jgi:hypothetical protein